eukprot:403353864
MQTWKIITQEAHKTFTNAKIQRTFEKRRGTGFGQFLNAKNKSCQKHMRQSLEVKSVNNFENQIDYNSEVRQSAQIANNQHKQTVKSQKFDNDEILNLISKNDRDEIQTMKIYFSLSDKFKNLKNQEERRQMFKKLILIYHPDKRHQNESQEQSQQSDVMFQFLKDNKDKLISNEQIVDLDLRDLKINNSGMTSVIFNTGKFSRKLAKNLIKTKYNNLNLLNSTGLKNQLHKKQRNMDKSQQNNKLDQNSMDNSNSKLIKDPHQNSLAVLREVLGRKNNQNGFDFTVLNK